MKTEEIWKILGMEKTKDEQKIKQAYRRQLVKVNPEDDPEGFKRLRQAYEEALNYTARTEEENEGDEYDRWLREVAAVYDDITRRTDESEWDRVFNNELCTSLDTQDIACERLLVFFMSKYYLPHFVWKKVESLFHVTGLQKEILERFPSNFIEFILNEIKDDKEDAYYSYFYGDLRENPDELIGVLSECLDQLFYQLVNTEPDERDFSALKEKLAVVGNKKISHLYAIVIEEIAAFYEKDMEKAKACFENLKSRWEEITTGGQHSEENGKDEPDGRMPNGDAEERQSAQTDCRPSDMIKEGFAIGYEITGEKEKAEDFRRDMEDTNRLFLLSDQLRYYLEMKEYQKAKELSLNCLEKYGNYPAFIAYMVQANDSLINQFKEKAEAGDIDSAFELGWIYFQNDRLTECIDYIEPLKPAAGDKNEYTYYNLLGRCCLKAEQFDKSIGYLLRAKELIEAVRQKGAEGNEEERMLQRYALILASTAIAYYEKAMALYENSEMNREDYGKAEEFLRTATEYIDRSIEEEEEVSNKLYFYREAASICLAQSDYGKCVDICDVMIELAPEWYYPYMIRQRAFYELDYPRNVMDDYDTLCRLLSEHLDNPYLYMYPLMTCMDYGRGEEAEALLKTAEENGAKSPVIGFLAACQAICQETGSFDDCDAEAVETYLEEIRTGENELSKAQRADLYFYATTLSEEEEYKQKMIQKGTEIYPGYRKRGCRVLASYCERKREYGKTIEWLNRALELVCDEEERASCRLRIGRNYWYMDEDDTAFDIYSEEYQKNPSQPVVNQYLAEYYLFRFRSDEKQESIDLALQYINRQMEIYTNQEMLRIRAEIYLEQFEIRNAKKDVLSILDDDPDNLTAKRLLEKILRHEGNFEEAYRVCKELLEVESDNRYAQKYSKFFYSCMALRKYDEIESCIKNGYSYDREWALENLIKLYVCMDRKDELMELGEASVREGQSDYEKFLGYRTILDALAAKGEIAKIDKAVENYIAFITTHEDRKIYGYECLSVFYFENYGNLQKAILYSEMVKGFELSPYYEKKVRLSLATYYAMDGNRVDSDKNFKEFLEILERQQLTIPAWLREDGYSRATIYDLAQYFYAVGDAEKLEKYMNLMKTRIICKNCDKCKCFEWYILKGELQLLKGDKAGAKEALEVALDCGEKINSMYISRLLKSLEQ